MKTRIFERVPRSEWAFLPYLILQVADIVVTNIALHLGFVEINPLGFNVRTVVLKMAVVFIVCLYIQSGYAPRGLVWMVTFLSGAVVVWSCSILLFDYLWVHKIVGGG